MRTTKIEWTDRTWNPVTGCTKFSAGCAHCYAETMANRLRAMGIKKYANGFLPTLHEDSLYEPIKWKKPHTIFVDSLICSFFWCKASVIFLCKFFNNIFVTHGISFRANIKFYNITKVNIDFISIYEVRLNIDLV
jgi:protein gp37